MAKSNLTLVFDPIPFKGGSKIATSDALNVTRVSDNNFVVLTVEPEFWQSSDFCINHNVKLVRIHPLLSLMKIHHGPLYWVNQFYLLAVLLVTMICHRKISRVIGASGPGIDMALYLLQRLTSVEVIQFIHGNVGLSRSIGYCLTRADAVFYLPSARESIKRALEVYLCHATTISDSSPLAESYLTARHYQSFVNGLPKSRWPSQCQTELPVCFWAASLLKWKGLDTLVEAARISGRYKPVALNICFIRPKDTCLPVSQAPVTLKHTHWYHDPHNLDQIRSQSNVFVSTSHNEPFGLSILEALAAGMCVVIPQDGAYWDQELTHNENCIKYQPNDADSLANALLYATSEKTTLKRCSANALTVANNYRAEFRYQKFAQYLNGDVTTTMTSALDNG